MKSRDILFINALKKIDLILGYCDILNIYFTYKKIKKGCYIDITYDKAKKFENILNKYKMKYKKYEEKPKILYFISKKINPKNINFINNNKLNHMKLGKFLGYGCVHNLEKDKPCTKGYFFNIIYSCGIQIYAFCCLKLKTKVIKDTLDIVKRMNKCIKKNLYPKFKGEVRLELNKNI